MRIKEHETINMEHAQHWGQTLSYIRTAWLLQFTFRAFLACDIA